MTPSWLVSYRDRVKTGQAPMGRFDRLLVRVGSLPGDVVLALGIAVFEVIGTWFAAHGQPHNEPLDAAAWALVLVGPAALVVRRRYPVAVLAVVFAATLTYHLLGYPNGPIFISLIVAFFTTVVSGRRLAGWISIAVGFASFTLLPWWIQGEQPDLQGTLGLAAWLLVLMFAAEVVRSRRERVAETARMREDETRLRVTEERLRIARELHDVLAHNISLINVQAGVALHLMDERPEQARTALATIKDASKNTLREMRSVLGVLRQVDEEIPRAPAPSLARLDELVSRARGAGLTVRTEIGGEPRPLPAGVDVAGYRIVQEALTNVGRHAGTAAATVRVTYREGDLTVEVDDDGRGRASSETSGGGHGITGMRERAQSLGGTLEAGPRPGGGFRVVARLPVKGDR